VCELHGISPGLLRDKELLRNVLLRAAEASGSTVVGDYFYKFEGDMGVTGVVVVAESHLSIHTWPEYGYAAVDVFTCGTHTDPWRALELLRDELKPERVEVTEMTRGSSSSRSSWLSELVSWRSDHRWIVEWHTPESGMVSVVERVLYSGRTKYQEVDVAINDDYGRCWCWTASCSPAPRTSSYTTRCSCTRRS
jgi:adenosylmethionine decarboxylase proenzyme (EC 4.1.1.50)